MARQGLFNLVVDLKTTNRKFEDASLPLELRYLVMEYVGKRDPLSFVIPGDDGEVKFFCGECNADESNKFDVWVGGDSDHHIEIKWEGGRVEYVPNPVLRWLEFYNHVSLGYDCAYMIAPSDDGGSLLWELNVLTKVWREVRRLDYVPVETACFDVIRYGDELRVAAVDDGGKNIYVWDGLGEKRTIECTGVTADLYNIWFVTADVVVATTAPSEEYGELVLYHVKYNMYNVFLRYITQQEPFAEDTVE
ncbi:hypothetical protein FOZ63_033335 [Perkinsus olseni]|uniref:Uncharacterized protein n=1 Tax=Perkinsus olseni TaxID=32597 RepID=A0A7J6RTJ9_PEROL|nr:hypothetical protein FOZ63_033335 [Perkinsus olseni]